MTSVLFAWEMGVGFGHIMPYLDLIRVLSSRGFRIGFAARDLANTEIVLGAENIEFFQAPALYGRARKARLPGSSYIDVLHNTGFSDSAHLRARLKAWRPIFEHMKPDVVVLDGAPAACLTARRYGCARITSGTGFFVPPAQSPLPDLRYWSASGVDLGAQERDLLDQLNADLDAMGEAPITALHQLAAGDELFLMNFPELDHYPRRTRADYLGTFPSREFGADHVWPELPGKKLFGYLHPFKTLPALLSSMNRLDVSATIYAPDVKPEIKDKHRSERLRFVDAPVNLNTVMTDCDVAVTNGSLSSSASILLRGKPLLLLPTTLEKQIVARRIQELGAGLSAPRLKPQGMAMKLEALLRSERFAANAAIFRDRYAHRNKEWQLERMLEKVDRLLGRAAL